MNTLRSIISRLWIFIPQGSGQRQEEKSIVSFAICNMYRLREKPKAVRVFSYRQHLLRAISTTIDTAFFHLFCYSKAVFAVVLIDLFRL